MLPRREGTVFTSVCLLIYLPAYGGGAYLPANWGGGYLPWPGGTYLEWGYLPWIARAGTHLEKEQHSEYFLICIVLPPREGTIFTSVFLSTYLPADGGDAYLPANGGGGGSGGTYLGPGYLPWMGVPTLVIQARHPLGDRAQQVHVTHEFTQEDFVVYF